MSLLTNNNTIHLYNRWTSSWYENSLVYSNLIYSDLYVYEFINGIYYQLKIPTSIPVFKELNWNTIIININLHLFKKRKKKRSLLLYNNKLEFLFFYKKTIYLLHKLLLNKKQFYIKGSKNTRIRNSSNFIFFTNNINNNINKIKNNLIKKKKKKNIYKKKIKFLHLKNKNSKFFLKKRKFFKKKLKYTNKKKRLKRLRNKSLRNRRKWIYKNRISVKKKMKKRRKRKNVFFFRKKRKKMLKAKKKKKFIFFSRKKKNRKIKYLLSNNKNCLNVNFIIWVIKKLKIWYITLLFKISVTLNLITNYKININITTSNFMLFITNNNILQNNRYIASIIYKIKKNVRKNFNWFNIFYCSVILNHLRYKIVNTLKGYLLSNVLFFPFYKKKFYNFFDVKLVCDYIKFKLQYGRSIVRIMRKLVKVHGHQRWKLVKKNEKYRKKIIKIKRKLLKKIKRNKSKTFFVMLLKKIKSMKKGKKRNKFIKYYLLRRRKINRYLIRWKRKIRIFGYKNNSLIGIRVECNGPTRKGKRTRMITYNEWVNYYKLPGKMPYNTKMTDLHYWQSFARTKRAAIGIKLWLFFRTNLYSESKKIRKNIKYKL